MAAAHRGERPASSWWPQNAWKPDLVWRPAGRPGHRIYAAGRLADLRVPSMITLRGRVISAKPVALCRWVFDLLGAQPGDRLDELDPARARSAGPGAVFTAAVDVSGEA